jgi:hypothetical protein
MLLFYFHTNILKFYFCYLDLFGFIFMMQLVHKIKSLRNYNIIIVTAVLFLRNERIIVVVEHPVTFFVYSMHRFLC